MAEEKENMKSILRTVFCESAAILMVALAIFTFNFHKEMTSSDFSISVKLLFLSQAFTFVFGICIALLTLSTQYIENKKMLLVDFIIRISMTVLFLVFVIVVFGFQIVPPAIILSNMESFLRYGSIFAGVNLVTAIKQFSKFKRA